MNDSLMMLAAGLVEEIVPPADPRRHLEASAGAAHHKAKSIKPPAPARAAAHYLRLISVNGTWSSAV